jgi:hypothetical protein
MLDHSTPTSWYVMERMTVPYETATSALGSLVPVSSIERATDGRFAVDAVQHARPGAVRGFLGRLRCGSLPWQTVAVEVAVEPWSHQESVVALRPLGRPPRAGGDRYFAAALTVLDTLRAELLSGTHAGPAPVVVVADVEDLPKAS